MSEEKKVLLSLKNVEVKFNVRGRILTAIRNVSLDVYEHESLAIVGESGSGKSVLTKTFAGMLDSNGFISNGSVIFSDDEISKTDLQLTGENEALLKQAQEMIAKHEKLEKGAVEYKAYMEKKAEIEHAQNLSLEEEEDYAARLKKLEDTIVDTKNFIQTLDRKNAEDRKTLEESTRKIEELSMERDTLVAEKDQLAKSRAESYKSNAAKAEADAKELQALLDASKAKIAAAGEETDPALIKRNQELAYEVVLSLARLSAKERRKAMPELDKALRKAFELGLDLNDDTVRTQIFESVGLRVRYEGYDEASRTLHGYTIIDCAKVKSQKDWEMIRGRRIATVFQDPMTSLNPVITIGKQIMNVILKHQKCSNEEAKARTLDIMSKVGIPEPEKRFDDYPFQYSGGMRQRIVIAIALSCQPKILICDEPTTALDVTIQAQILELIKQLQKDLGFTTVYITHDLGVVANVAERVVVLYSGQIVELGMVEEIFYDPRHPYTWALLSSLPQLSERGTELFSIPGTPPSLYNKIIGDAFAPRNQYAMAIDLVEEPPMFKISDTHYAKTWLCDPRAPKVESPANIHDLHEKMLKSAVNVEG